MEANEPQKAGLSRRALIKRGAIAGGVVWTAPAILSWGSQAGAQTTECAIIKIASVSGISQPGGGLDNDCTGFQGNTSTNFTDCITAQTLGVTTYTPSGGFLIILSGAVAQYFDAIAVKYANNDPNGCTCTGRSPSASDNCREQFGPFSAGISPYAPYSCLACTDPGDNQNGFAFTIVSGGNQVPGTAITIPAGGWGVIVDTYVNVNYIGIRACFPVGSVPPPC